MRIITQIEKDNYQDMCAVFGEFDADCLCRIREEDIKDIFDYWLWTVSLYYEKSVNNKTERDKGLLIWRKLSRMEALQNEDFCFLDHILSIMSDIFSSGVDECLGVTVHRT